MRQIYHYSNLNARGKSKLMGDSMVQCRNKGGIQFSNSLDKGKQPIQEKARPLGFVRCPICNKGDLARLVCRQWSFCKICRKSGHVAQHCVAWWKQRDNKPSDVSEGFSKPSGFDVFRGQKNLGGSTNSVLSSP